MKVENSLEDLFHIEKKKLNGKHIGPSSLNSEIKLKAYVTYFSELQQ